MQVVNINLRKVKEEYGLTRYQLAEKLNAKQANIGAYLEGRAEVPNQIVKTLFEVLDLPKEKLYDFLFNPELKIKTTKKISFKTVIN